MNDLDSLLDDLSVEIRFETIQFGEYIKRCFQIIIVDVFQSVEIFVEAMKLESQHSVFYQLFLLIDFIDPYPI